MAGALIEWAKRHSPSNIDAELARQNAEFKREFQKAKAVIKERVRKSRPVQRIRNVAKTYVPTGYNRYNKFSTTTSPKLPTGEIQVEAEDKGMQKRPPIKPFYAPEDTEINSMDGIYRPFTLGENGNQFGQRATIFDPPGESEMRSAKRRSIWLRDR